MTFDVHELDHFLLVAAAVTFLAVLAVRASSRFGMPSLLVYLLIGFILGDGIGFHLDDAQLADDVAALRFTDAVAREAMRLYPPAYLIGREGKSR